MKRNKFFESAVASVISIFMAVSSLTSVGPVFADTKAEAVHAESSSVSDIVTNDTDEEAIAIDETAEEVDAEPETEPDPEADLDGTKAYIFEHADLSYVGTGDSLTAMDALYVTNTYIDPGQVPVDKQTLDGIWLTDSDQDGNPDYLPAVLGQQNSAQALYTIDPDSAYMVAKVNSAESDQIRLLYGLAGSNDLTGTVYNDVILDKATGLVYVPKVQNGKRQRDRTAPPSEHPASRPKPPKSLNLMTLLRWNIPTEP